MKTVTFTVRTITPLFLAGADQTTAELRAPTFRGLMRYWYRALVGGIVGANERTLEQVAAEESTIFGATDTGSAIRVQVFAVSKDPQRYRKEGSRARPSGKDYLLWSMAESGRDNPTRYKPDRLFFPPDTTFQVVLSSRGDDEAKLQQAVNSFWLLTHLGGIGSRSRRCAGSLTITQIDGDNFAGPSFDVPQDTKSLQKHLQTGITHIRQSCIARLQDPKTPFAAVNSVSFDALAKQTCSIWILRDGRQRWSTSDDAMRAIGTSLQNYRSEFDLQAREVFGLPLGRNSARYASPLLLRVTELQEVGYVGIAVLFKTGNKQRYTIIEDWAHSFSGKDVVTF